MAELRRLWRALLRTAVAAVFLAGALIHPALAQDAVAQILTVDQDRLFVESAFGRSSLDRERVASTALEAENAQIEAALIAEEQDLTNRRPALETAAFTVLADAFDQKVERIRAAQDAKARDLGRTREADRLIFRRAVVPVLDKLMQDRGAVAIIDVAFVIRSASAIDVTDAAIIRIDAALGPDKIAPLVAPSVEPEPGLASPPKPSDAPATP